MNPRINWPLILPLAFLFVVAIIGFVVPTWLVGLARAVRQYGPSELSEQWLGFFGNVIAAILTGAAILFAWFATTRQMQLTYFTREEDRIERELPGLWSAFHWASAILAEIDNVSMRPGNVNVLLRNYTGPTLDDCIRIVRHHNPLTNDRWQRRIASVLYFMKHASFAAANRGSDAESSVDEVFMRTMIGDLRADTLLIKSEIEEYERSAPVVRKAIRDSLGL